MHMKIKFNNNELENVGHAISTLIQQRFVWIFHHKQEGQFFIVDSC